MNLPQHHPPVPSRKRRILEAAIRTVDMVAYVFLFASGIALLFLPLAASAEALLHYPGLIAVWATFLIGGGLTGFLGRMTGYWMVENTAVIASAFGAAIYIVVLAGYAFQSIPAAFTLGFIGVAFVLCIRRWLELQLFGAEPGDLRYRLRRAIERRVSPRFNRTV